MAIAGKVSPVPKGEWNSSTSYEKLNIVTYNECAYIAIKDSKNKQPVQNASSEFWMFLISNSTGSIATPTVAGKVKPDNTSITITSDGTISAVGNEVTSTTEPSGQAQGSFWLQTYD